MGPSDRASLHDVHDGVTRALLRCDSPSKRLQRCSDSFVDSGRYAVAWIGRFDPDRRAVVPVAGAGIDVEALDAVPVERGGTDARADAQVRAGIDARDRADAGGSDRSDSDLAAATDRGGETEPAATSPTSIAFETGTSHVETRLPDDRPAGDWRAVARDRGCRSIAAVPLVSADAAYGVLHLGADGRGAFDEPDLEALETIGETIAFALTAPDSTADDGSNARPSTPSDASSAAPPDASTATASDASSDALPRPDAGAPSDPDSIHTSDSAPASETGERSVERELDRVESRLKVAASAGSVGTWTWDVQDDVVAADEYLARTYGMDPEEAAIRPSMETFYEPIHEDDEAETWAKLERAIEETGELEAEYRIRDDDGELRWVLARGEVTYDEDGEPVRMDGAVSDITDRKERERELAASERRYRTLAENFPGGVGVFDEDLRYTLVDGTMWDEIGVDTDDLEGKSIQDALPETAVADVEPIFRDAIEGETGSVVCRLGDRTYQVWATPLRDPDGEVTAGQSFALDVTEQRERERELRRYAQAAATVDDGIYALDANSHFTMVNDAYCELTGYDRTALLGEHASFVHSEAIDAQVTAAMDERRSGDGTSMPIEVELETAEGEALTVEAHVSPFEYDDGSQGRVGVVRDVTERKERERVLEQYRTITQTASDVIVTIDEESVVRSVNPAVEEVFGYEPAAVVDAPLTKLMSEEQARDHYEGLQRYVETGERALDWDRIEVPGQHADGHDVPLSVSFSEYEHDGDRYFAGIIRDVTEREQFERALTELHGASRDLVAAETPADVADRALDAATNVLGLDGVGIYLFEEADNALRPAASTPYLEETFDGLPTFGPGDSSIIWQAFLDGEPTAHDDVLEAEHVHRTDTPLRSGVWIPLGDHGVLAIVSESVGGLDDRLHQLADHLAATAEAALDRIAREESIRDHEREVAEQNRRLQALDRMNAVIREIDQELIGAETKDDIEASVCELLTRDDRFELAWIGGVEDGSIVPRAWAGAEQGYIDELSLSIPGGRGHATDVPDGEVAPDGDGAAISDADPAVTTAATGEVTVESNVSSRLGGAPWRSAALSRGLQSAIAIPLQSDEVRYGVLTVYAADADAFDELPRSVLPELGRSIANGMNAVETERALLTDSVVELDLAIDAPDDPLVRLVDAAGCTLEFRGFVPQAADEARVFVATSDASADDVRAAARASARIDAISLIEDDGEDCSFELSVTGSTIPSTLVDCGGAARSLRITPREARAVVELPHAIDVRAFVDRLETTYPDIELIARRDKQRDDPSRRGFRAELTESLTDRQLEALQTAYLSGYFEWPRERTGEEVAESLDITQSTFNGHLRAAERTFCTLLFDRTFSSPSASFPSS